MDGYSHLFDWLAESIAALGSPVGAGIGVWCLAWIFLWSGAFKLRRPGLVAEAVVNFGLLSRPLPRIGRAVGAVELVVGLALATYVLRMPALGVATALLWLFTLLILRSLVRDRHFPCYCFGEDDRPIGWRTAARTLSLAVASTALLAARITAEHGGYSSLRMVLLEAMVALALVSSVALAMVVSRLVTWNSRRAGALMGAEL